MKCDVIHGMVLAGGAHCDEVLICRVLGCRVHGGRVLG